MSTCIAGCPPTGGMRPGQGRRGVRRRCRPSPAWLGSSVGLIIRSLCVNGMHEVVDAAATARVRPNKRSYHHQRRSEAPLARTFESVNTTCLSLSVASVRDVGRGRNGGRAPRRRWWGDPDHGAPRVGAPRCSVSCAPLSPPLRPGSAFHPCRNSFTDASPPNTCTRYSVGG